MERSRLLKRLLATGTLSGPGVQEHEDSEFFVRMFEHEFGDDPPWRRPQRPRDLAFVLQNDGLGAGEPDLGSRLMGDLLLALAERQAHPKYLVLLTRAVYLVVRDSPCLPSLQKLEAVGTRILVSKASLEFYDKQGDLRVGEAVSMLQIVDTLYEVEKVISL